MTKIFASVAAGIGLGAIVAAGQVQAYSVQSFFQGNEIISQNAQGGGLLLALSTEAYRSQQTGNTSRAACIIQALIPEGKKGALGFDRVIDEMRNSKNKSKESVESYVVGAIDSLCSVSHLLGENKVTSLSSSLGPPTYLKTFFQRFQSGQDKFDALSLAMSTQALRVMNAGAEARGKCILDNLTLTRNGEEVILPLGIQRLAKELGQIRESNTESVEAHILANIDKQCGKEN
jgi:hypothetical protein